MTASTQSLPSLAESVLMHNYGRRTMTLVRGQGVHVWDAEGRQYTDLLSGLGVNNLGHCHPKVVEAIQQQAQTLLHVSNLYLIEPQVQLAELLVQHSPADKVFFCNSGTEAIEAAIKMARKYSHDRTGGSTRYKIIALQNSFHGRTMGSISATGQPKYHQGFEPLLEGFIHVPLHDLDALQAAVDGSVCAVLLEPVLGEGGIHPCEKSYLQGVREICDRNDMLLIFDEIQCGLGRSGNLFASDDLDIEPDAITLAKSLAGGVPIGALLAKEEPASCMGPGTHAATFGGNPLSCAAGVAALNVITNENLPERSRKVGARFLDRLSELGQKYPQWIKEVRGKGLMIGVELTFPAVEVITAFMNKGYIAGPAGPNVLRFLPPLIIEEGILDTVVHELDTYFAEKKG